MEAYCCGSLDDCNQLLSDYLEIKNPDGCEGHPEVVELLLMNHFRKEGALHLVESLLFNDVLMVLKAEIHPHIEHMLIVNHHAKGNVYITDLGKQTQRISRFEPGIRNRKSGRES